MLMHSIMDPTVGTFAGSIVEPTDVPTEDILPPILPPTENILPASDNIPVRFTFGIVISSPTKELASDCDGSDASAVFSNLCGRPYGPFGEYGGWWFWLHRHH